MIVRVNHKLAFAKLTENSVNSGDGFIERIKLHRR